MARQPMFKPIPESNTYGLAEEFAEEILGIHICIPQWFTFDGASIPVIAWGFTYPPFHPKVMKAALIHDWLYFNHQVDRATADSIFKFLLEEAGVPVGKYVAMWHAVDKFGAGSWKWNETDYKKSLLLKAMHKDSEYLDAFNIPDVDDYS